MNFSAGRTLWYSVRSSLSSNVSAAVPQGSITSFPYIYFMYSLFADVTAMGLDHTYDTRGKWY